ATVQIAARRHARSGRARAIGTSSTSGGIGKKLLSANAITASQTGARGEAASASVRAYSRCNMRRLLPASAALVTHGNAPYPQKSRPAGQIASWTDQGRRHMTTTVGR